VVGLLIERDTRFQAVFSGLPARTDSEFAVPGVSNDATARLPDTAHRTFAGSLTGCAAGCPARGSGGTPSCRRQLWGTLLCFLVGEGAVASRPTPTLAADGNFSR
jgi:hypothetical protein